MNILIFLFLIFTLQDQLSIFGWGKKEKASIFEYKDIPHKFSGLTTDDIDSLEREVKELDKKYAINSSSFLQKYFSNQGFFHLLRDHLKSSLISIKKS